MGITARKLDPDRRNVALNLSAPIRILLGLVLDYARWSQLVPMLTVWGFAVLMILALLLVNHQEQALTGLGDLFEWLSTLPWLGEYLQALAAESDGVLKLSGSDLTRLATRGWMIGSLAFALASAALGGLFGPFRPIRLGTKILLALGFSMVILSGSLLVFFTGRGNFNGGTGGWVFTFGGTALIVFLVGAWSLSISHALGMLKGLLEPPAVSNLSAPP